MKNELIRILESVDIQKLTEKDKEELLRFLTVSKNVIVRDRIALILTDVNYVEVIPVLMNIIMLESSINNNGTLIYALDSLNVQEYFLDFINIICKHDYEARLMALDIIEKYKDEVPLNVKQEANLILINNIKLQKDITNEKEYENSPLHFMYATVNLLNE